MREKPYILLLIFSCFLLLSSTHAQIWQKNQAVTQGEPIIFGGFDLEKCTLNFNGSAYKFNLDIPEQNVCIGRIPTTPLCSSGLQTITVKCPDGDRFFNVNVLDGNFPLQHIKLSPSKSTLTKSSTEIEQINEALKTYTPYRLWDGNKRWILPSTARISTYYGLRRTYNGKLAKDYFHKGWDFAAAEGTPIVVPANGRVVLTGTENEGFNVHGNCVFINHGQGIISAYLHMKDINVVEGQWLNAGQTIGTVGSTGIATGPHLHFGIYIDGENVNPVLWFNQACR